MKRQFINRLFFNFVFERQFINRLFAILFSKDNSSNEFFFKDYQSFSCYCELSFLFLIENNKTKWRSRTLLWFFVTLLQFLLQTSIKHVWQTGWRKSTRRPLSFSVVAKHRGRKSSHLWLTQSCLPAQRGIAGLKTSVQAIWSPDRQVGSL